MVTGLSEGGRRPFPILVAVAAPASGSIPCQVANGRPAGTFFGSILTVYS